MPRGCKRGQAQLESDLIRAWRNDPLFQEDLLRSDTAVQDAPAQRMAATYPRHENDEFAN